MSSRPPQAVFTIKWKARSRSLEYAPEPVRTHIAQAIESLRNAGQGDRIVKAVSQCRHNRLIVPGTVIDTIDFIKSANYLAHVQWALGFEKEKAIELLAGNVAARSASLSKSGNDQKRRDRQRRNTEIRRLASSLKAHNSTISVNSIAKSLEKQFMSSAEEFRLTARQIKRILAEP